MRIQRRGYFEDDEIIRGEVSNAVINEKLIERVDYIIDDTMLHNDTIRIQKEEEADLTELFRMATNMSDKELIVCVVALMQRNPFLLYQCLAEDHMELFTERKRRYE